MCYHNLCFKTVSRNTVTYLLLIELLRPPIAELQLSDGFLRIIILSQNKP